MPLQPIGRLYWENSGLSEISTQTLGNVNIHGFAGGVRGTPVIDVRGVLGSKRPSGIYSRRNVLSDYISGYAGKTLVFEK